MSHTQSSDRDNASRMRTRVTSPSTRNVSAREVTEDEGRSLVFSTATFGGSRWKTSQVSSPRLFMTIGATSEHMNSCSYVQFIAGIGERGTVSWFQGQNLTGSAVRSTPHDPVP